MLLDTPGHGSSNWFRIVEKSKEHSCFPMQACIIEHDVIIDDSNQEQIICCALMSSSVPLLQC